MKINSKSGILSKNDDKNFDPLLKSTPYTLNSLTNFYKVRKLGQGSYAEVFLVKNKNSGAQYAMKSYNKSHFTNPYRIKNVRNEIEIMFKIDHPSIVKGRFTFETSEQIHILMEYAGDTSLVRYL